jgi:ABC-type lipoprotein export system ATPase subunit
MLNYKNMSFGILIEKYPFLIEFFKTYNLPDFSNHESSVKEFIESLDEDFIEENGFEPQTFYKALEQYIEQMLSFLGESDGETKSITIIAGNNKSGEKEQFDSITIKAGEIICIVGPTGSGKSRLLADIEWMAQEDTPTKRKILINGEVPDRQQRFSGSKKMVAQLSQNMNFVMDLTVREFVDMHAESRMIENKDAIVEKIIDKANDLAGESFSGSTHITSLSGGQSRALMIADTAYLSKSPIVLIDEIENAGIDRKKALQILVSAEKIVLMATHDPVLALMGDQRLVIKNGGVAKVIHTDEEERSMLEDLEKLDKIVQNLRHSIRIGEKISNINIQKEFTNA